MKSKLILIILCVSLFLSSITTAYNYYPPAGNWQQGDSNGTFSTTIGASLITLTVGSAGARNYVVTTAPINLGNISYLEIDWSGSYDAATTATVRFGISPTQMDNSFTTSVSHTTTFTRQKEKLDVSNYFGNYYIKMGTTITGGFVSTITMRQYSVELFGYPDSYPRNATDVTTSTATLRGYLVNDSNLSVECGFWVGNVSVNASNFEQNVSGGSFTAGTISTTISSLSAGTYYYVRSWTNTTYGFNVSANESYFLTYPNAPSSFTATCVGPQSIKLTWTNATCGNHTNQSVYIRYTTGSPVTDRISGTFAANESNWSNVTISGLDEQTQYNFTAWTYANASGSPFFMKWSSFTTCSSETEGGTYNIIVRYENESTSGNIPVDLSIWGKHRFNIHYANLTDYVEFDDGICTSSVDGFFGSNASGNFTFISNTTVEFIEFLWNFSNGSTYQCSRTLIPDTTQNLTFYIRTNMPVYGVSSGFLNDSLVTYTYSFNDPSKEFEGALELDSYVDIYTFNSTGRLTIHKQYWDAQDKVYPMLVGCKKYFIGVGCSTRTVDRIAVAPTPCSSTSDITPDPIRIPISDDISYAFFDVININQGWLGDETSGFYVYYYDTMFATNSVTIRIWDINGTMVYIYTAEANVWNFTYAQACKLYQYNYTLTVDHEVWDTNQTITGVLYPGMKAITDVASLNDFLNKTFGYTPFVNAETLQEVPWSWVLVFVIGFIIIVSFGQINAYLGTLGCGVWFAAAYGLVIGLPWLFLVGGIFLVTMSLIFAMGGKT